MSLSVLIKRILILLALLTLVGCQTVGGWFNRDEAAPPAELVDIQTTLSVKSLWSNRVVDGLGSGRPGIVPVYSNDQVWVADRSGRIVGIDARSGRVRTSIETDFSISAGPVVADNSVLVGTFEGEVVSFDLESGRQQWRARVSSEVLSSPLVSDGKVVVRVLDGRVYGFDLQSGERHWVYDRSVPLLTLRGNSAPIARAGRAYIGFDDGVVVALRLEDGSTVWEQRVSEPEGRTELERMTDIDGPMVIVGTELYVVTYKGRMASLAVESGRLLWVKEISAEQGLSLRRTALAATDKDDAIWLVDRRNSTTLWREDRLARRDVSRPVFYNDYLVVTDFDGYMHWLDAESGAFVARVRFGSDEAVASLVVGNTLYIFDAKGRLSAWQATP